MVDKQVFLKGMNQLLSLFPGWEPNLEKPEIASMFHEQFNDLTDHEFTRMVDNFIKQDRFNPTIGGLRQYIIRDPGVTYDQMKHEEMLKENGLL